MPSPISGRQEILGRGLQTAFRCKTERLPDRFSKRRFYGLRGQAADESPEFA
jgi:hypothetical protein